MDRGSILGGTGLANTAPCPGGGRSVALRPPFGVHPESAALGGAGLAVRLAVLVALVAGLLPATGLLALVPAALTALASLTTIHGTTHAG